MKKFKTFLATLLAVTMVLGSAMTVFAEEIVKEGTAEDALQPAEMDITIDYQKGDNISADNDDTTKDIINIAIKYDNLDFSFEADAIKWDATDMKYKITLNNTGNTARNIVVANNSNTSIEMTSTLAIAETQPSGLHYQLTLHSGLPIIWAATEKEAMKMGVDTITLKWGKKGIAGYQGGNTTELCLNITNVSIDSAAIDNDITKTKIAQVSLAFENVGKD